ncbi:hypothetical protein DWB84_06410 [Saccharophagus sp. K07]|nr:hypothetical protein [Saccharophagus sp. K07]
MDSRFARVTKERCIPVILAHQGSINHRLEDVDSRFARVTKEGCSPVILAQRGSLNRRLEGMESRYARVTKGRVHPRHPRAAGILKPQTREAWTPASRE